MSECEIKGLFSQSHVLNWSDLSRSLCEDIGEVAASDAATEAAAGGDRLSPLWVLQRVGHFGRGNRDIAGGSWRPENAARLYTPPSATSLPAQTKLTHIVLLGFTTATTAGYLLTHYRQGNSSSPSIFNAMDAVLSCIMHLPSFYFFESNNFYIIGPKQSHCSGEW